MDLAFSAALHMLSWEIHFLGDRVGSANGVLGTNSELYFQIPAIGQRPLPSPWPQETRHSRLWGGGLPATEGAHPSFHD